MKKIIYIITLVLFISCNKSTNNKESISISFEGNDSILASDIFKDNFRIVPLETNENSLFSLITDICIADDRIFIIDITTKRILAFDKSGKHISTLKTVGRGPGEFTTPTSITVNNEDRLVFVLDPYLQKVIIYNFNLDFIKESKVSFNAHSFSYNDNSFVFRIVGMLLSKHELVITDMDFQVTKKLLPKNRDRSSRGQAPKPDFNYNGKLMFYTNESNSIYEIDKDSLTTIYKIDKLGTASFASDNLYKQYDNDKSKVHSAILNSNIIYSVSYVESENNLVAIYFANRKCYVGKYNKDSKNQKNGVLKDDFNLTLMGAPMLIDRGKCIYPIYSEFVLKQIEGNPETPMNNTLKNVQINDNPLIAILELK